VYHTETCSKDVIGTSIKNKDVHLFGIFRTCLRYLTESFRPPLYISVRSRQIDTYKHLQTSQSALHTAKLFIRWRRHQKM